MLCKNLIILKISLCLLSILSIRFNTNKKKCWVMDQPHKPQQASRHSPICKPNKTKPKPRLSRPNPMYGQPNEGIIVFYQEYNGLQPTKRIHIQQWTLDSPITSSKLPRFTKTWPNCQHRTETYVPKITQAQVSNTSKAKLCFIILHNLKLLRSWNNPQPLSTLHNRSSGIWGPRITRW